MKTFLSNMFFGPIVVLTGALMSCSAERVAVGPAPPCEQEVMRFRSANSTRQPVVFGQIKVLDKAGAYVLPSAILSLDKKLSYADEKGCYLLTLTPGTHQFMTGQIGIYQSRLRLEVSPGDSVRINFNLRPDLRPLD